MTFSLRAAVWTLAGVMSIPAVMVLVGLGARFSAMSEIATLRSAAATLRFENDSYRAVTGELATQVASLQGVLSQIGESPLLDQPQRKAIANLPSMVRNRAMGGAVASAANQALMGAPTPLSEDTFGVLRDLLGVLEKRLQLVRTDAQKLEALADATPSMWPVAGWLTDGFGQRRDPFTGDAAQHLGLDIAADKGTPIYATAAGQVKAAGFTGDFGNLIVVEHEFGLTTRYGHLSQVLVQAGQHVERGDLIGRVGSTGRSTAPHLHYEVWANGRPLNPLRLLTR